MHRHEIISTSPLPFPQPSYPIEPKQGDFPGTSCQHGANPCNNGSDRLRLIGFAKSDRRKRARNGQKTRFATVNRLNLLTMGGLALSTITRPSVLFMLAIFRVRQITVPKVRHRFVRQMFPISPRGIVGEGLIFLVSGDCSALRIGRASLGQTAAHCLA
jgi:hypothetical protein